MSLLKKEKKSKTEKLSRKDKRIKKEASEQIVRIEELEALMQKYGNDVDPETLVSMYLPHRKRRKLGAALLQLDRMHLLLLGLLLAVAVLFIAAFAQEKMGNFTINLNRLELYRKGISIADNGNFDGATARLVANTVQDATNISIDDIPTDVDDVDGGHNGKNYMAYTYYVRNAGKEDLGYIASITLDSCAKGAEKAVRIAVYQNGERIVYAAPADDGGTEDGVDAIIGGSVQFSMSIDADYDDHTSLLWKYVKDIKDTLVQDKPISAAGNEAPNGSYYPDRKITWDTRRNK